MPIVFLHQETIQSHILLLCARVIKTQCSSVQSLWLWAIQLPLFHRLKFLFSGSLPSRP